MSDRSSQNVSTPTPTVDCCLVIPVKGRLDHLKQTLQMSYSLLPANFRIVVVDYDCPDGTYDWVHENGFPKVDAIRVPGRPVFNMSEARNIGTTHPWARAARFLLFFDADTALTYTVLNEFLVSIERNEPAYVCSGPGEPVAFTLGNVLVPREVFDRLGGYDEAFDSYGYDDTDFLLRLMRVTEPRRIEAHSIEPIQHDDAPRFRFSRINSKSLSMGVNKLYMQAKHDVFYVSSDISLSQERCRLLRTMVNTAIHRAALEGVPFKLDTVLQALSFNGVEMVLGFEYEMEHGCTTKSQ